MECGARSGQRLRRALKDPATGVRTAPLCFASRGFSLHAATRITGPDRRGLERLCRYVARPAHGRYGGAPCRRRAAPGAGAPVGAQLSVRDALPPRLRRRVDLGRTGGSGPPVPVPSPALPRGPGPPCPRPRSHRAGQAGCRAGGGGRRYERSVLRPYCEPCPTTCKRSSASLPCPLGVFGALTREPKRCLILPVLIYFARSAA